MGRGVRQEIYNNICLTFNGIMYLLNTLTLQMTLFYNDTDCLSFIEESFSQILKNNIKCLICNRNYSKHFTYATYSFLPSTPQDRYYWRPHLTNKETEAWGGELITGLVTAGFWIHFPSSMCNQCVALPQFTSNRTSFNELILKDELQIAGHWIQKEGLSFNKNDR